ncbi:hypothetical protein BC832DRAFT_53484 [Gaertneriomyces semiglobifer]|nr:hypothetical protein BC832DRAFT_53484 [Gaertneriomyces semiglobifer]
MPSFVPSSFVFASLSSSALGTDRFLLLIGSLIDFFARRGGTADFRFCRRDRVRFLVQIPLSKAHKFRKLADSITWIIPRK